MSPIRVGHGMKILVAQVCDQPRPSVLSTDRLLGAETVSHIRENGRITILFHAFEGPARIVRLYGKGPLISYYICSVPPSLRRSKFSVPISYRFRLCQMHY